MTNHPESSSFPLPPPGIFRKLLCFLWAGVSSSDFGDPLAVFSGFCSFSVFSFFFPSYEPASFQKTCEWIFFSAAFFLRLPLAFVVFSAVSLLVFIRVFSQGRPQLPTLVLFFFSISSLRVPLKKVPPIPLFPPSFSPNLVPSNTPP